MRILITTLKGKLKDYTNVLETSVKFNVDDFEFWDMNVSDKTKSRYKEVTSILIFPEIPVTRD